MKCWCTWGGWERGRSRNLSLLSCSQQQVSPDPEHCWGGLTLGAQHSKWSCQNRLLKVCRDENFMEETEGPQGERCRAGRQPGRHLPLRWIEACPTQPATNAGYFLTITIALMLALRPKKCSWVLAKLVDPSLLTHICAWEENRWLFIPERCTVRGWPSLDWTPSCTKWENIIFWVCFSSVFNLPSWQMSEVKWREKPKLVTGCKRAHGQHMAEGIGEGTSASGCRHPAPKVKLSSWVQAGCVWDQNLLPAGRTVLQSFSDPTFHYFAPLGCRADGREVKLMRTVGVRCFFCRRLLQHLQIHPDSSAFLVPWVLVHLIALLWQVEGPPAVPNVLLTCMTCI